MIVEASYIPVIEDYNKDGTLKLSAILKILENAGNCHSDSVGDNVLTGSNNGKAWVLTDWKLEIISYPVYGNDIKTQTWGEDGKSPFCLMRDFLLYADGQLCVKGTTQWVLFDLNTGKICRVEADLVNKYEPESKKFSMISNFLKLIFRKNFLLQKKLHSEDAISILMTTCIIFLILILQWKRCLKIFTRIPILNICE